MPTSNELLMPKTVEVTKKKEFTRAKQAKYYDVHTKALPVLKEGDSVRVALKPNDRDKKWTKAEVKKEVATRSYEVETEAGVAYRRNRRHIRTNQQQRMPTEYTPPVPSSTLPDPSSAPQSSSSTAQVPSSTSPELRRSTRDRRPPSYLRDYVKCASTD